jgi:hypothetical protein
MWSRARKVGRVLLATIFVVGVGRLDWAVWAQIATLSGFDRAVAATAAAVVTAGLVGFFYVRLWREEPLFGSGMFASPDLGPAADAAVTTIFVWFLLTGAFAFATYLADRDALTQPREPAQHAYDQATEQYAWHAADVIPFVKATQTLNWTQPSDHWKDPGDSSGGYSTGTGILLVIYKAVVLAPVLAAAAITWRLIRDRRERLTG